MEDLFSQSIDEERFAPLAFRVRPRSLADFVGQTHIVGPNSPLRAAIAEDRLFSMLFYGPPGTGKTALARLVTELGSARFEELNAVGAKVEDIRRVVHQAKEDLGLYNRRTVLFIDELHRFTKTQQDALLPDVEQGIITLIGATTENPFFTVIPALVSRTRIFEFKRLSEQEITLIMDRALENKKGLVALRVALDPKAREAILALAGGDARIALNLLEGAVLAGAPQPSGERLITLSLVEEVSGKKAVLFGRDEHYDLISAFIKSIRGSDPDAAVYWLARMLYSGEDPRFLARRLMILASEDIGPADPYSLPLASSAFQAAEKIGMPEVQVILSHVTIHLAAAPKSNSALAIFKANKMIEAGRVYDVPDHLKDSHYKGAKKLGRGEGYKYPHDFPGHHTPQTYWPGETGEIYKPSDQGFENRIKERLERLGREKEEE